MTGYISINDTLVKLADNTSYANYSDIAIVSNLGFQFYDSSNLAAIGPVLLSTVPNITLWNDQYKNRCHPPTQKPSSYSLLTLIDCSQPWEQQVRHNQRYSIQLLGHLLRV